jgi:hypothetical protein
VAASAAALYSSSWVGIDGLNDDWLIQTGTDQDSNSSGVGYDAWFEIITPSDEAPSEDLDATVAPGDAMTANLQEVSSGTWQIYLADATQNWYFQQDFSYGGPSTSAEWIEEAPTVNGQQSSPAHWSTAHFASTAVYDGSSWYSTNMNSDDAIDMVNSGGNVIAAPGAISAGGTSGQSFSDVWGTPAAPSPVTTTTTPPRPAISPPSNPTRVAAKAEVHAINVTWIAPTHTGGRAIGYYIVQEYRGGVLHKTVQTASRTFTAGGLTSHWRYSFKVAASNRTYTSAFSAASAPIHAHS